jgi:hypothetical protein
MISVEHKEADPEAAALVMSAYEMIAPHWQAILPPLRVKMAKKRFDIIPELKEFCEMQNKTPGWKKSNWEGVKVICPEFDKEGAVLWCRRDAGTIMYPPDYYFQKNFFEVVAKVIWFTSEKIREEVKSQGAGYVNFRDTFSRFFLNPEWLKERREEAWAFICRIDESLRA